MNLKLVICALGLFSTTQAFANKTQELFDANIGLEFTGTNPIKGSSCSMNFDEDGKARVFFGEDKSNPLYFGVDNFRASPFSNKLVYQYGGAWTIGCIITGNYCHFTRWEMVYENDFRITQFKWAINGQTLGQCDFN